LRHTRRLRGKEVFELGAGSTAGVSVAFALRERVRDALVVGIDARSGVVDALL
jgi:hypothetical protein